MHVTMDRRGACPTCGLKPPPQLTGRHGAAVEWAQIWGHRCPHRMPCPAGNDPKGLVVCAACTWGRRFDDFRCLPYASTMSRSACAARHAKAHANDRAPVDVSKCRDCPVGAAHRAGYVFGEPPPPPPPPHDPEPPPQPTTTPRPAIAPPPMLEPEETPMSAQKYEWNGESHTAAEWAVIAGVSENAIRLRIKNGLPLGAKGVQPKRTRPAAAKPPPDIVDEARAIAQESGAVRVLRALGWDVEDLGIGPNGKRLIAIIVEDA